MIAPGLRLKSAVKRLAVSLGDATKRGVLAVAMLFVFPFDVLPAATFDGPLRLEGRTQCAAGQVALSNDDWQWLRQKRAFVLGVAQPDYPPFEMTVGSPSYEGITADVACYLRQSLHIDIQLRRFADRGSALAARQFKSVGVAQQIDFTALE